MLSVYRREWQGSVFSGFIEPLVVLAGLGIGLGVLVGEDSRGAITEFLGPSRTSGAWLAETELLPLPAAWGPSLKEENSPTLSRAVRASREKSMRAAKETGGPERKNERGVRERTE